MSVAELIASHGYVALALGLCIEGETVVLAAGIAAWRGLLSLGPVIMIAFVVSFLIDQVLFYVGRFQGGRVRRRFPVVARVAPRIDPWLQRHQNWLIIGMRFMIGLRTAAPLMIGAARISPLRFASLNLIGAAIWSVVVATGGYFFGSAIERALEQLHLIDGWIFAGAGLLASLLVITFLVRNAVTRRTAA